MIALFIIITLFLSSCSFDSDITISCTIPADHPYEEISGKALWHTLVYFDGNSVKTRMLDAGIRTFRIKVKSGGLRAIAVIPLGKLSPLGGFFEDGDDGNIRLYSEYGSFARMVINAAKERPKAVSQLSIRTLKKAGKDIGTIDQASFLEMLFDGTLKEDRISNSPYFRPKIEGLPRGYWVSDSAMAESFYISNEDEKELRIFSGSYNYWNVDKELLLTIVISEDGRFYTSINRIPELY